MQKIIKNLFFISISICILSILLIFGTYLAIKPNLPEIKYVDESELQMPLKVYTKDGVLIGEFGEMKRRATSFDDIPNDIKTRFDDLINERVYTDGKWGSVDKALNEIEKLLDERNNKEDKAILVATKEQLLSMQK